MVFYVEIDEYGDGIVCFLLLDCLVFLFLFLRLLIIGVGNCGRVYVKVIWDWSNGVFVGVVELVVIKC